MSQGSGGGEREGAQLTLEELNVFGTMAFNVTHTHTHTHTRARSPGMCPAARWRARLSLTLLTSPH